MAASNCGSKGERRAADPDILILEPFYCGSHRQLVDCLMRDEVIGPRVHLVTMSGKKWHWRARVSALHLTSAIPVNHHFRVLFSSSVLNLAELVALRADLSGVHKVLYFHENQLQYPVQKQKERDFQYGYNQILSCLVADSVLFNSAFNMESFLTSIHSFLKLMPDYRPQGLADSLRPKCSVLYFPVQFPDSQACQTNHRNHFSRNAPKARTSPANSSHDLNSKQTADGFVSPSAVDVRMKGVESNRVCGATQTLQAHCACGSHMQSVCRSPTDSKEHGGKADVGSRTELHPQAKVGRMDCELAANAAEIGCCSGLGVHGVGDDATYPTCPANRETMSPAGVCSGGFVKRSVDDDDDRSACHGQTEMYRACLHKAASDGGHGGDLQDCGMLPWKQEGWMDRESGGGGCLHIVWPHRWEHDKDPQTFFQTLFRLQDDSQRFVVSVLGETFTDVPDIFAEAEQRLKGHILSWGYQADKGAYFRSLQSADVVVSTSKHEFFGVAMLEAVYKGCYPLCPRSLVYPELYPDECLYSTPNQLYKRLKAFCKHPHLARHNNLQMDLQKFSWSSLRPAYLSKLHINS